MTNLSKWAAAFGAGVFLAWLVATPAVRSQGAAKGMPSPQHVNAQRLQQTLEKLSEFGRNPEGGVTRLGFSEADLTGTSDGASNRRLYLPATAFNRFAVTREINDGLLAPRFAPSQRAYVLGGHIAPVAPSVPASFGQDADNR